MTSALPRFGLLAGIFIFLTAWPGMPALAASLDDLIASRPAFSGGDLPARTTASCGQVRAMAQGVGDGAGGNEPDFRVDLSVAGILTSVRTDCALWYLTMCNLPDLRIMCVAYQQNEMKAGDFVFIKGGFRRVDKNHVLLDPCLANQVDGTPGGEANK